MNQAQNYSKITAVNCKARIIEIVVVLHTTSYLINQQNRVHLLADIASGSTADYFYMHKKVKCTFAAELRDTGKHGMLLPERYVAALNRK